MAADILRFINELTVNGKPVDEDDIEDDYTKEEDTEQDDDENKESKLNLDLTDDNQEDNTENKDDEESVEDDYTVQANALDDSDDNTSEPDNDTTDPADDTEPGDTTEPTDGGGNDDGSLDMGDDSDDDYTADNGETSDETPDTTNDNPEDGDTSDNSIEDKIKQTEAEVFNTLTDDEKAIRNRELIDNFIRLKTITKMFLEKTQTITVTDENDEILAFVGVSLLDLNNMISDYIITRYNKKSYIENFVTYQQFILTIEQLKNIVSKLNIEEKPQK